MCLIFVRGKNVDPKINIIHNGTCNVINLLMRTHQYLSVVLSKFAFVSSNVDSLFSLNPVHVVSGHFGLTPLMNLILNI